MVAEDGCELTTLEAYASAAFGRHYRMEAWICPEADAQMARKHHECQRVMHEGEVVWACSLDPIKTMPPEQWRGPSSWRQTPEHIEQEEFETANKEIVERIKKVLPKLDIKPLKALFASLKRK